MMSVFLCPQSSTSTRLVSGSGTVSGVGAAAAALAGDGSTVCRGELGAASAGTMTSGCGQVGSCLGCRGSEALRAEVGPCAWFTQALWATYFSRTTIGMMLWAATSPGKAFEPSSELLNPTGCPSWRHQYCASSIHPVFCSAQQKGIQQRGAMQAAQAAPWQCPPAATRCSRARRPLRSLSVRQHATATKSGSVEAGEWFYCENTQKTWCVELGQGQRKS